MMELAPEDELRLNVMMAGDIQAVRIDEAAMIVHGLSSRGEASIKLHPTGRAEQYLRRVREMLAGKATGFSGWLPGLSAWLDAHGPGARQGARLPVVAWGSRGRGIGGLFERPD